MSLSVKTMRAHAVLVLDNSAFGDELRKMGLNLCPDERLQWVLFLHLRKMVV